MRLVFSILLLLASLMASAKAQEVRLNHIQVVGTHNSYHIAPHRSMMALIGKYSKNQALSLDYTHRPLPKQFSMGIRQIELDVYADPEGGKYAKPRGLKLVAEAGLPAIPNHDPDGELQKPGLKVLHAPDVDFLTTVRTFVGALNQIKTWSKQHPQHVPIMIMVEVKQGQAIPGFTKPSPFDAEAFDTIDREILSIFERSDIITPDGVRGDSTTLREAVVQTGWPLLKEVRGKVMFALDNGGELRDTYLKGHPALNGRMLFVSVEDTHPAAAFMKLNDPIGQFEHIQKMVRKGFLVRTRADSGTVQARNNDTTKRDKAMSSGAHFVSTDYPEPNQQFSKYCVQFASKAVVRANPVNGKRSPLTE